MTSPQTPPKSRQTNATLQLKKQDATRAARSKTSTARKVFLTFLLLAVGALAALPGSSAARRVSNARAESAQAAPEAARASATSREAPGEAARVASASALAPTAFFYQTPPIATYDAADCSTPKSSFNLGEDVCVKVSDAPTSGAAALVFSDPDNFTRNNPLPITTADQTFSFTLPSSATTGGFDNRGTWAVSIVNTEDNSRRNVASFRVHDPNQSVADVTISKTLLDTTQITAGNDTTFRVYVTNQGPDAASNVAFTDNTLPNTTFVSFTQVSGPTFTCTPPAVGVAGSTECTRASMADGDVAVFTAVYKLNTGVSDGAPLEDTIEVESATFDSHESSNSSTVESEASNPSPPPCSLACPANISVGNDTGQAGAVVPFGAPTTAGSCGALTSVPASGSFFQTGSSVVTFTEAGGQSCSFAVTVTDEEDPAISCPADITVDESSIGSNSANVNFNVTATDNDGSATVSCNPASGSSFNIGTTEVTCIATDQSGNTSECSFDVTVKEATCTFEQPLDIVEDADINATGSQSCGANVTFATPTATCPDDFTSTVTCDHASGSFFPIGDTVVTCKSNPDGATTSFTVTVKDITAPAPDLTPLPTITGECSATAGVPTTVIIRDAFGNPIGTKVVNEPPTATDNCGGKILAATNDQRTYDEPGTYTVNWTYTDASGNVSTQTQTVVVTGPNGGLSITGPPVVVVHNPVGSGSCSIEIDDVGALMNTTVGGSCGGFDITRTVSPSAPGNIYTVGATYSVTSTVTDGTLTASVTQQLKIVDDTQPTITAPANVTVNANPVSCSVPRASVALGSPAIGAHCGVPTATNNAPSAFPLGQTIVTWTVTDTSGNTATANQVVTVVDVTAPVITLNGSNPMTVECHTSFTDPGASASDACDASVPVNVSGSVNVNVPGSYTLTYNASDDSGNAAVARTRTVNVVDTTPPTISCPVDILVNYDPAVGGAVVNYTAPVGTDSCAGTLTANQTAGLPSGATFPIGSTTNTFVVTDPAGLTASCSFKVNVALTSIVGLDSVSITGAGPVDSYDSNGGYASTKGSLASVVSNGTITMTGSAKVAGSVRSTHAGVVMSGASQVTGNATAGTTVSRSGSATVGGTITNNAIVPSVVLPPVPSCGAYSSASGISGNYSYNPSTGDLNLSGVNIATLANGTYCFHNLSVGNSAQLKVNGPVTIRLTGTLSVNGAASINNTTLIPGNLRILSSYTGSNGVSFGNSASAYMLVYAPGTGVTLSGASPLFGTVAGKSITISNSGMLHYDTRLQTIWPSVWQLLGL